MYNIVLFKVYLSGDNIHSYSEHLVEVEDQIEQYLEKQDKVIFFRRQTEGSVLLFKVDSEQEFDTYSKKVMLGMVELLGKYNDLEYFFGIGKLVQRIREIPESFEEANRAFSYRYMVNNQHYITYEQIGTLNKNSEEEINLDLLDSAKIDRAIITNFLKSGLEEEVKHFLYDYFVGLGLSNLNSLLFRQYVALDLYLTTIGFLETILQDTTSLKEKFGNINSISNMITDINSTRDYLEEILRKAIEVRDTVSKKKYEDVIVKAKEYIFENYANENISLNSVAAFVNISPSYFSSLFSQETGHTFVEYLTNIRMDKAKQLLRCTSKKTSDIGYEVGYKDSHYFSYLFRKTQNCSPKEFRAKGKNG